MADQVVTLYGRNGCHLCEEARVRLEEMRRGGAGFTLVEVDGVRVSELILDADAVRARLDTLSR